MPLLSIEVRMIRVACPKCAKSLGLPDTAAGKNVKCPQCQQVFKAPASSVAAGAVKPDAKNGSNKGGFVIEEATAYGLQEDKPTPEQLKKSAQGEEIDAMVVDAQRNRIRAKAWEKVGMPTKFVKRAALTACIIWLCVYLFMLMVIVLANHNMENADAQGMISSGGKKAFPRYLFVQDMIREIDPTKEPTRPVYLWLYCTGFLIIALAIYGLQLAGAESMKKLENYRLSMFAMLVGTFSLNLFAILGLLALMDKGVQYEFRVSQRRLEGKTGAELYEEDEGEEEDEDEDDEEVEDDEKEEHERPTRRRK
jgi:phage FluMu protein Com